MKSFWKVFDRLLIHLVSLTGLQVQGFADFLDVDCLPEYLDPKTLERRPSYRPRFV